MVTFLNVAVTLVLAIISSQVDGFSVLHSSSISSSSSKPSLAQKRRTFQQFYTTKNPVDELSEERKQNLYRYLLRDMEVEGTPVLECDADQAHTFQGTVWTVMAQLSESDLEAKACMVLKNMPMDALQLFVDNFDLLKSEEHIQKYLPEVTRFNVTLLGKGVGPALVVETANRTTTELETCTKLESSTATPNELTWTAAMKSFVARRWTNNDDLPILPGPHAYRLAGSWDACDTLATFWTSVCELLAQPEDVLGSSILCLPKVTDDVDTEETLGRFAALTQLVTHSLFDARGQELFDVSYLHPLYDRDSIDLGDNPSFGHAAPMNTIQTILKDTPSVYKGNTDELTEMDLALQNYQRRSPLPAIFLQRKQESEPGEHFKTATIFNSLAEEGEEALQEALKKEMELV
jgi:hypothetical protein